MDRKKGYYTLKLLFLLSSLEAVLGSVIQPANISIDGVVYKPNTQCIGRGYLNRDRQWQMGELHQIAQELLRDNPEQHVMGFWGVEGGNQVSYIQKSQVVMGRIFERTEYIEMWLRRSDPRTTSTSDTTKQSIGTFNGDLSYGYDSGHILAAQLGGPNDITWNYFPQHRTFNRGAWRKRENLIRDFLETRAEEARVFQTLRFDYPTDIVDGSAPIGFYCNVQVWNGVQNENIGIESGYFENPSPLDTKYICPVNYGF